MVTIVEFDNQGEPSGPTQREAIRKSDSEWLSELGHTAFHVLRKGGTEMAFSGQYDKHYEPGIYRCRGCGLALFASETKFRSGSGWPSFTEPIAKQNIRELEDNSLGMRRVEVRCALCDGHQGHVFPDGPPPTGLRYCINSASLRFDPANS